ncbi:MAG: hypothetical protein HY000_05880 [Planctomycetes bacterium]|nr:hypothetical protein [Planctomycetota bacterium]
MRKGTWGDGLVMVLLVAVIVIGRLGSDVPNFAPVAAAALFAGFFLPRRWLAAPVPLVGMILSDAVLGGYEWRLMLVVYAALCLPVVWGPAMRRVGRHARRQREQRPTWLGSVGYGVLRLGACALACSITFFVITNFAVWLFGNWYPRTLPGLLSCYAAGVPFFRYTLLSDFSYSGLFFGTYALARVLVAARRPIPQRSTAPLPADCD